MHGDAKDGNHTDVSKDETPAKPPDLASSSQARKTNGQWSTVVGSKKQGKQSNAELPTTGRSHPKLKKLSCSTQVARAVFYLGGVSPERTDHDITDYCVKCRVRVSNCRILSSRRFGTVAARLSVAKTDAESTGLLSEGFWPEHIYVRKWVFPEDGELLVANVNFGNSADTPTHSTQYK